MKNGSDEMFRVDIVRPEHSIETLKGDCSFIGKLISDRLIYNRKKNLDPRPLANEVRVDLKSYDINSKCNIIVYVHSSCSIAMEVQDMLKKRGYLVGDLL